MVIKKRKAIGVVTIVALASVFSLATVALGQQEAAKEKTPPSSAPPASPMVNELSAKRLSIAVWPEYDDPRVLAIIRGAFDPSTFQPTQVGFNLPPLAEIIGAGYISDKGDLLIHPYQVIPSERGDRLIMNVPVHRFFLEYYYQAFGPGPNREFVYEVPINFPIEQMELRVQRPLTATDFSVEPPAAQVFTDGQGFQYHAYQFIDLEPGTTLTFRIKYTKTNPSPSVLRQPAPPVPQAGPPPSPPVEGAFARVQTRYMPYLLGGLVVVGVGLIILWAMGRVPGLARRAPCDSCERMVPLSHRFCPYCGADQSSESPEE